MIHIEKIVYRINEGLLSYSVTTLVILCLHFIAGLEIKSMFGTFSIIYIFMLWGFQRTVIVFKKDIEEVKQNERK